MTFSENATELLRGENGRRRRSNCRALNKSGLVGLVHHLRTSVVGNRDFTDVATVFLQQRDDRIFVFRTGLDGDLSAANAYRGDRCVHGHCIGA